MPILIFKGRVQPTSGAEAVTHVSKFKYFSLMSFLREISILTGPRTLDKMT